MNLPTPLQKTAGDLLDWLDDQQHAGRPSVSTVARLATVLHGQTFVYRESQLVVGHDFVEGTITVLTERHVFLLTLTRDDADDGFGGGASQLEVLPRSALRRLITSGPERMGHFSGGSADLPTRLELTLVYDDGTLPGRVVTLAPVKRGRLKDHSGQEQLVAALLADLAG